MKLLWNRNFVPCIFVVKSFRKINVYCNAGITSREHSKLNISSQYSKNQTVYSILVRNIEKLSKFHIREIMVMDPDSRYRFTHFERCNGIIFRRKLEKFSDFYLASEMLIHGVGYLYCNIMKKKFLCGQRKR